MTFLIIGLLEEIKGTTCLAGFDSLLQKLVRKIMLF